MPAKKAGSKISRFIFIAAVAGFVLIAGAGVVSILRYQALADDEPEVVLAPALPDLVYCTPDGTALALDLYFPTETAGRPYPLLVYIHGGSFTAGDKRKGSGVIDIPAMTVRGYAVAAVNYRLMPKYPYPSGLLDVKCAIRFLRAHAAEYALATERIGVWGGSAGGFYATWVGLANDAAAFEVGEYLDQSSRVSAVAEMFGPTDLTAINDWLQRWLLRRAFGTDSADNPRLYQASPINFPAEGAPPFLILHGAQDSAVPLAQAQSLDQHLRDAHVDTTLIIVENANHNFKPTVGPIKPGRAEISSMLGDFFDAKLR